MSANGEEAVSLGAPSASSSEEPRVDWLGAASRLAAIPEPDEFGWVPPPPPRPLDELYPDGIAAAFEQAGENTAMGHHDRKPPPPPPPPERPSDEKVLSKTDASSVLAAVRATRAARSTVDGAATGPPLRKHSFLACLGDVDPTSSSVLHVINKDGDSVPATSLCQFVQQAAAEQLEVYREIKNRGLLMPQELPIDAPYKHALKYFTGLDKGLHNWRAYQELLEAGEADCEACDSVPGQPRGRVLSFLVDAEAIAALAEQQASADATAVALGQALADDVVGNVLPFVAALPRDDNEVVAFLKAQCSTDCGAAGAKGLYLEVAESEDWKGRLLADIAIYSTHEGDFSYVEPRAALPEGPVLPDHATLSNAGPEAAHSALRALCTPTGRAGDYYGFSAAGSDACVVSLPSQWLKRKNEEVERCSQFFRELFRPRPREGEMVPAYQDPGSEQYEERRAAAAQPSPFVNLLEACSNFRPRDAA